jgi:hypothetical protein
MGQTYFPAVFMTEFEAASGGDKAEPAADVAPPAAGYFYKRIMLFSVR